MLKSLSLNMSSSNYTAIVNLIKQYNDVCDNLIENGLIVKKTDLNIVQEPRQTNVTSSSDLNHSHDTD